MPITTAFTVTALVAVFFNLLFLSRTVQRRMDLDASGQDGELKEISNTFVSIWSTILVSDLLILLAGIGLLSGIRPLGYLLAVTPIASTLVGILALRGLLK